MSLALLARPCGCLDVIAGMLWPLTSWNHADPGCRAFSAAAIPKDKRKSYKPWLARVQRGGHPQGQTQILRAALPRHTGMLWALAASANIGWRAFSAAATPKDKRESCEQRFHATLASYGRLRSLQTLAGARSARRPQRQHKRNTHGWRAFSAAATPSAQTQILQTMVGARSARRPHPEDKRKSYKPWLARVQRGGHTQTQTQILRVALPHHIGKI